MIKQVLEISGIQKRVGNKMLLSDIYLKCETSQILGLLGRNGSGKSTLLKIIAGVIPAPDRCVRIDSVSKNKQRNLLNEISYLPQKEFIPKYLSVKKAISLSIDQENRIVFSDDEFIQSIVDKKISQLSVGERRYLEVKIVLFNPSKFILLDEPYSGLSPLMVDVINELIRANSEKKGIIITDHNFENVIKISSQIVLIKEGKTHNIEKKEELVEKGYLTNLNFLLKV